MAFITLDRSAFYHNLDRITEKAGNIGKVALVLKDNAYGHGLDETAAMASAYGVTKAVVRTVAEARRIEKHFAYILVLSEIPETPFSNVCFTINALEDIGCFPQGCRVELKVDTGMHRNGIAEAELERAFAAIREAGLELEAVFTHHRSADELGSDYFWQRKRFDIVREKAQALAKRFGFPRLRFHSANSAALFRTSQCRDDMVRIGIAAYGCLQMAPTLPQPKLKPVLSLWAQQLSKRQLKAGERIGYGGTFEAPEPMNISVYDLGYADGLLRSASNRGYIAPGGEVLLGRISMDNCCFRGEKEELQIFNDARRYAEAAGTIPYEVLVGLSPAIERRIIG